MSVADPNPTPPDPTNSGPSERPTLPRTPTTERMIRATLAHVLSENRGGSWLIRSKRDDLPAPGKVVRNIASRDDDRALVDRLALPTEQDHGADRAA